MCWNKVDNQCKIMYGDLFVTSPKPIERKFIISAIAEEFPHYPRVRIAVAVDQCFKINATPINRRDVVTFLQSSLR